MRIEATIPDKSGEQLAHLATELGVSKSQLIEEALAILLTAALEAKQGRRVAIIEGEAQRTVCQLVTPILAQLEWAARREVLTLSKGEVDEIQRLVKHPPAPTPALRRALSRKKR